MPNFKTIVISLMFVASAARAEEPESPFVKIELWQTREVVISLMGRPHAETNAVTLGVPHSKLRWTGTGGQSFAVFLLGNHVVAVRSCAASNDC
jgi:hypothetical protein